MQAEILEMQKKTKTIANAFLEKKGISEKQITTQQITRDKMTINALDEIQKDIKEYMRLRKGETKLLQKDEALRIKQLEAIKARTYGVIMAYMDSIPAEEQAQIIINGKSAREYLYEEAKKIIPEEGRKSKKEEMDARGAKTDFINTLNLSFSYEFLQEVFDTYVKTSEKIGALENSVNSRKITDVSDYNVLRSNHYNYGYSHEVMRSRTSS